MREFRGGWQRSGRTWSATGYLPAQPNVHGECVTGYDGCSYAEAVFLEAFEAYDHRPQDVRFGDWLDHLIDQAVKSLRAGGDYLDNVRLARSGREAQQGPAAV